MSSLLSPKDMTVTRCPPIVRANLFKSNSSLVLAVDDKYMFTRTRNALVSLITSIESLGPPSCWYNLSDNGKGCLYELLRFEDCVFLSILKTCGLIWQKES